MIFSGISRPRGTLEEQFVQDRRREEASLRDINAYLKVDRVARHVAAWEDRSSQMAKNRFTRQRIEQLRAEFERKSAMRRAKLKELYDKEDAQYEEEVRRMRPSADQIKQRMIEKVNQIKRDKQAMRAREVQAKLDRRFKDGADELRKIDSEINEFKTKHERDVQMIEKQKKLEREYAEEMIYAELWRRDVSVLFVFSGIF